MSLGEPVSTFSESFSGQVRLFPLPGLVVFPHVVQPLHIFEPRYCEMLEEAVSTDRLIAMVLLQAGWEQDYQGRPPIAPVACLGRIVSHERLPNGKHNILLQGVQRVAIRREHPASRAFRQADVDLLEDVYPEAAAEARPALQKRLVQLARELAPDMTALQAQLDELLASQIPLGMLTDIFAFTLGLPASTKQRLLAEWNVDRRAELLSEQLAALLLGPQRANIPLAPPDFPPPFSLN